jgi:outer membrane protein TolC
MPPGSRTCSAASATPIKSAAYGAQASAADLENIRLTAQADLAVDYFQLRGQDALKQLLDSTVVTFQQSLDLTRALYETGIDSDEAVAEAETQLEATQAQDVALGIQRAQFEHAIAMLTGQPRQRFQFPSNRSPQALRRFPSAFRPSFWSGVPTSPKQSAWWLRPTPRLALPEQHTFPRLR